MSRKQLVQNAMLFQRDDLPRSARAPWDVFKEHVELDDDASAQVKAWYDVGCNVGFEKVPWLTLIYHYCVLLPRACLARGFLVASAG